MQKVVYVDQGDLTEVNKLLEEGWEVKSINNGDRKPVHECRTYNFGRAYAYIVLEKK